MRRSRAAKWWADRIGLAVQIRGVKGRSVGGSRLRNCAATVACAVLLGSCATAFNEPINVQVASNATIMSTVPPPDVGGDTVVALAFSGGGTRAAAFAHGVMRGLSRIPAGRGSYFVNFVFVAGVPGVSVFAAHHHL